MTVVDLIAFFLGAIGGATVFAGWMTANRNTAYDKGWRDGYEERASEICPD